MKGAVATGNARSVALVEVVVAIAVAAAAVLFVPPAARAQSGDGPPPERAPSEQAPSERAPERPPDQAAAAQLPAQVARVQELVAAGQLTEAEALQATLPVPERVLARLRGVIALERQNYEAAAGQFARAIELEAAEGEAPDPQVSLYLAHTLVKLGRFNDAIKAAKASEPLAQTLVAQPLVLAHALRGARRLGDAFAVLSTAAQRFPKETAPRLELVAMASQQALRTVARQRATELLELELDRETALAVIHALHRDPKAMPILERVAARFRDDAEIRAHLAHGYAAQENWYAAGFLFEQAALLGGDYAFEAADQYRLAGATRRALAMNGRVADGARRLRQRLSILYTAGEMARVTALEAELFRRGITDDATLYRLAYAHFALSEFERATRLARRLIGTGYEGQATSLLGVMGRAVQATQR